MPPRHTPTIPYLEPRWVTFTGAIRNVQGRGDTDFRPVFAPALLERHRADGVVYFTDGQGRWPTPAPPMPTLWVLIGDESFLCPWGRHVRLV